MERRRFLTTLAAATALPAFSAGTGLASTQAVPARAPAVLEHDGQRYLVRKVLTSCDDGCDGFETAVLVIDVHTVDGWLEKLRLAADLGRHHGLDGIEFYDPSPEYYNADWEAEPLDEDETYPPLWDAKGEWDGRTDLDRLHVSAHGWILWEAYVRHTDLRVEVLALSDNEVASLRRAIK